MVRLATNQCLQSAVERVDQAIARGIEYELAIDLILKNVVDNAGRNLIGFWSNMGTRSGHGGFRER